MKQKKNRATPKSVKGASKQKEEIQEKPQFTVRLEPGQMQRFEEARLKDGGGRIAPTAAKAIDFWANHVTSSDNSGLEKSLADSLASAVLQQLRSDIGWATSALGQAGLSHWDTTFHRRVRHFFYEKKSINRLFIPWLVSRIIFHISHGKNVSLIVESGTTLKSTFDEIVPELCARSEQLVKYRDRVQIITNNYPGATAYENIANDPTLRVDKERISDIVRCHLVPGRALQDYAAVVGEEATTYLEKQAREFKEPRETVIIGLAVGNWMMLENSPGVPAALARGEGHSAFKKCVLAISDEVFLISPLCKLFLTGLDGDPENVERINADLRKVGLIKGIGREYERVPMIPKKLAEKRIKMVTTRRDKPFSIAYTHSLSVNQRLGRPLSDYSHLIGSAIAEIPHFIFPHDDESERPYEEQLRLELPHEETHQEWFREKYFKITSRA